MKILNEPMLIRLDENQQGFIRNVPLYPSALLGANQCARYVRLAARGLFDINYAVAHAWNRRYEDRVLAQVRGRKLGSLADEGVIVSGTVIGVFNPRSKANERKDKRGRDVDYTHNALCIGRNSSGEPVFIDQFGRDIYARTEGGFRDLGLVPVEVIGARDY